MTLNLPPQLEEQLAHIASASNCDPNALAVDVLSSFAEERSAFIASIKSGISQLDSGENLTHEQAMQALRERVALHSRPQ